MAFTGTATVKQISERLVRITGLSLVSGATGTISLAGGTGSVKCPAGFQPKAYTNDGVAVGLQDSVDCNTKPATAITTAIPVEVVKTGTTPTDFLITLTNNHGSLTSPGLEIYVEFH